MNATTNLGFKEKLLGEIMVSHSRKKSFAVQSNIQLSQFRKPFVWQKSLYSYIQWLS